MQEINSPIHYPQGQMNDILYGYHRPSPIHMKTFIPSGTYNTYIPSWGGNISNSIMQMPRHGAYGQYGDGLWDVIKGVGKFIAPAIKYVPGIVSSVSQTHKESKPKPSEKLKPISGADRIKLLELLTKTTDLETKELIKQQLSELS